MTMTTTLDEAGAISRTRLVRFAGLTALGLLIQGGPALAHAHLKTAVPAVDGAVPAAPTELDLTFSEGLDLKFSGLKITGPDKKPVPTGAASLKSGGDTTLVVPLAATLPPGRYTVAWHALSADGHKTSGTYRFTVAP